MDKPWDWVEIVKPPQAQRLPDVLTRAQTHRLLGSVYKLRYRVFFVTLHSTGLRLGKGLALQVGDIDGQRMHIHVGGEKGRRKRVRGEWHYLNLCRNVTSVSSRGI
jgi:integrase/recombinase XerD